MSPMRLWGRCAYGFTLLEILVALAVLGVSVSLFTSLFIQTLALSDASRNESVAVSLAEERLESLLNDPGAYVWPGVDGSPGQLLEVAEKDGGKGPPYSVEPPPVTPLDPGASRREQNVYNRFSWQAYAKLPRTDAGYLEVTAVIRWSEAGRGKVFALTAVAPRMQAARLLEGRS